MRITFRALASGLVAVTLLGAGVSAPLRAAEDSRFQGVTLRIGTWGGATRDGLRDYVASEIEKRGGKVEFVIGSPQDNFAKVIAARGQPPEVFRHTIVAPFSRAARHMRRDSRSD